jgi:transcriptional regulator GlxA family with amidase domain
VQIAIFLFESFTALDAVALHNALSSVPGADITFTGLRPGPCRDETRQLELTADAALTEIPHPQLVVLPGGIGALTAGRNRAVCQWLAGAAATGWTVALSDGVLIVGRAGLLSGRRVAAPSRLHSELTTLGATPTGERIVIDGRLATAVGADAAIQLASLLPIHTITTKGLLP